MAFLFNILIIFSAVFGRSSLPELTTKQDIKNIRYISSDGKFTYYQRNNGSLQFSTNYKVTEVIKLKPHTHFNLISSKDHKFLLVEAHEDFHNYLAPRNSAKVYLIKYGTAEIKEVGSGKIIGLHYGDQWFTYFDSFTQTLILQNTASSTLKHSIRLANVKNPYFSPQVVMTDPDTIFYTDINKEGIPGILRYKLNASQVKLAYKETSANRAIEICLNSNLYFMSYGLDPLERKTFVDTIDIKLEKANQKYLYESNENDVGSLVCQQAEQTLFFIKTYRSKLGKITYDAIEHSLEEKTTKKISDISFATNLIKMDDLLLLPYQDKYYILKGKNIFTETDRLLDSPIQAGGSPL